MRDGHAALLDRVLELHMAASLRHLHPPIPLNSGNNFSAFHCVYLYTLASAQSMQSEHNGNFVHANGRVSTQIIDKQILD
jgi:hypothetical protein